MVDNEMQDDHGQSLQAELTDAINSGIPERVAEALKKLRSTIPPRDPIQPPAIEVLDVFPDGAPSDVVRDYIWVLANYRPFTPPLTADEIVRRWTEAALRTADGAVALYIVLQLRHDNRPEGADVVDVISYLATRGVKPGREEAGAEYIARYLLDHSQTYERTVQALPAWNSVPTLRKIVERIAPYVRDGDRGRLGLD